MVRRNIATENITPFVETMGKNKLTNLTRKLNLSVTCTCCHSLQHNVEFSKTNDLMVHYWNCAKASWILYCHVAETISVDQTVAQAFKLRAYQDVIVNIVDPKVRAAAPLSAPFPSWWNVWSITSNPGWIHKVLRGETDSCSALNICKNCILSNYNDLSSMGRFNWTICNGI